MSPSCRKLLVTFLGLASLSVFALAKRVAPRPVPPVISDGIRYSVEGDGRNQFVVAADVSTAGHELWRVKVFHNHIKFWQEEDVQWVFITDLKLVGNSLVMRDERLRCYSIDLMTKQVKKQQCSGFFQQ